MSERKRIELKIEPAHLDLVAESLARGGNFTLTDGSRKIVFGTHHLLIPTPVEDSEVKH